MEQAITDYVKFLADARDAVYRLNNDQATAKQLKDELNVTDNTLKRWEEKGLKRYQPPLEDTRKAYYKVSDILIFLGVEK